MHKKNGAMLFFTAVLLAFALAAGCSRTYTRFMKLPSDSSPGSAWAVVRSAYAYAKKMPDAKSEDAVLVRRGTVFPCAERKIDPSGQDTGGLWYEYKEGSVAAWLHSGDVDVFPSENQARAAASALLRN